ncbi:MULTISPECIES: Panacea domain-containing protein [Spiroplasma]|uniref:Panacea domain-containing protein n=1 Tax=Spiroplasma TaxID=2132 RepID=UPI0018DEBCBA|nr:MULTISPECIES: type II toxin-antitoxin system antitoxin SocA domain-containing protein [Spiroplasma]MBH8623395.1 hypothetical protein [Spiroplasma sp. hyd1]UNF62496.1 DUF4065 domain-containing protein [Spiroplasma poulsonii]
MKKINNKINNKLFSIVSYLINNHKITEPVKLQKVLYFLYLDYLKQYDEKLFEDEFEAWVYGPVLRKVYYHLRYVGINFDEYENFKENKYIYTKIAPLEDKKIIKFIDEKIEKYKNKDTFVLVEEAHNTEPWINARKGLERHETSREKIKFSDMEKFVKNESNSW